MTDDIIRIDGVEYERVGTKTLSKYARCTIIIRPKRKQTRGCKVCAPDGMPEYAVEVVDGLRVYRCLHCHTRYFDIDKVVE